MICGPKILFYGENSPCDWSFGVRSFTDFRVRYEVNINLGTGECECGCMHFQCRLKKRKPTILDACKHVKAILQEARRRVE